MFVLRFQPKKQQFSVALPMPLLIALESCSRAKTDRPVF